MQSRWRLRARRALAAIVAVVALGALGAAGCGRSADGKGAAAGGGVTTLALLYCGWEVWIGTDQNPRVAADEPTRAPGALAAIQAALDRADLAHAAPPGARGLALAYADGVVTRVPPGPIANLTGAALGGQVDYTGTIGVNLVQGVTRAVDELERAPAGRRLLVVVSDGTDTNLEQAGKQLPGLKQRIDKLGIEVRSIVYKSALSGDGDLMAALTDRSERAMSRDDIELGLVDALRRVQGTAAK
jgi:hypothetical protein